MDDQASEGQLACVQREWALEVLSGMTVRLNLRLITITINYNHPRDLSSYLLLGGCPFVSLRVRLCVSALSSSRYLCLRLPLDVYCLGVSCFVSMCLCLSVCSMYVCMLG